MSRSIALLGDVTWLSVLVDRYEGRGGRESRLTGPVADDNVLEGDLVREGTVSIPRNCCVVIGEKAGSSRKVDDRVERLLAEDAARDRVMIEGEGGGMSALSTAVAAATVRVAAVGCKSK